MRSLQRWLRGAVRPSSVGRSQTLACASLALVALACLGCDPAPDNSSSKKQESSESSESSSEGSNQGSQDNALDSFARSFPKRYKKINVFACETNSDYCVDSFAKVESEDVEMSFFLAFEQEDLKTSQHAKYIECFTESLKASNSCVEKCEDANDDEESTECSKSSMLKCMDQLRDDHLDECDLKGPGAEPVFEAAMIALQERINPSDGGG